MHEQIRNAVARFNSWDKESTVMIISHLDADGISASAIMIGLMNNANRKYSITILPQLDEKKILELKDSKEKYIIFSDLGSGQLREINDYLSDKEIIILDHHEPVDVVLGDNIVHVNPHLSGIDGSKEISGAGVSYLFAEALDDKNQDLSYIAIIGAIGDIQEANGFGELNTRILNKAIERKKIKLELGLKFFGMQTRPLHKLLEYSSDPFIPGVSGSESGSIHFLNELGIDPKKGSGWKKMHDLSFDEKQRLIAGVVMKRISEGNPEEVLGNLYLLEGEKDGSPMRDLREFATLLNACGRMNRASCGIGACLGFEKDRSMALQTLADYKKEIVNAINWYHGCSDIVKGDNYIIINARDEVLVTIIGTLASIISKSKDTKPGTFIMSMARNKDGNTKVSLRMSKSDLVFDLRSIVKEITDDIGGEAGGHIHAAGAIIPVSLEDKFILKAKEVFSRK